MKIFLDILLSFQIIPALFLGGEIFCMNFHLPSTPFPQCLMTAPLRMSATGRSYTQNFLKVHYIIIKAILGRKSMKKFSVTNEKIFRFYKAFDRKN